LALEEEEAGNARAKKKAWVYEGLLIHSVPVTGGWAFNDISLAREALGCFERPLTPNHELWVYCWGRVLVRHPL
jgi:hypothetical protein